MNIFIRKLLIPTVTVNLIFILIGFLFFKFPEYKIIITFTCVILFIIIITNLCYSYFLRIAQNREIISLKSKLKTIHYTQKIRIKQWSEFVNDINHNIITCNIKRDGSTEQLFKRRNAVSEIVKSTGSQFYTDLHDFCLGKEHYVCVYYLQYEKETDCLKIIDDGNFYLSPNHPMKNKGDKYISNYIKKLIFNRDDGSAAAKSWNTKKLFFIPSTDIELSSESRNFIKIDEEELIESIYCHPIFKDEMFFGVFCFCSYVVNGIGSAENINKFILEDLDPIFSQIKLIEYVNHSFRLVQLK